MTVETLLKTLVIPPTMSEETRKCIAKARVVHGDLYDYSMTVYTHGNGYIIVICRIHGPFVTTATKHIGKQARGCTKCNAEQRRKTTAQFIEEARAIHGDTYDYSKTVYKGCKEKTTIICRIHGEFEQDPSTHLQGKGCPENHRKSTEQFIEQAIAVHGRYYDYSKVVYVNSTTPVIIICPEHGEFSQTPDSHLANHGCRKNHMMLRSEFIRRCTEKHNSKYDYSLVVYLAVRFYIDIICPIHGKFTQKAQAHLNGHGCWKCAGCAPLDTATFIVRAQTIHGDEYDYSGVEYTNINNHVWIWCYKHKWFLQQPHVHLGGHKCPKCYGFNKTTEEFVKELITKRGNRYDYSKVIYKTQVDEITIICRKHGEFNQRAASHLHADADCPKCSGRTGSKISKEWLNFKAVQLGCHIQHFGNGKEYKIPGTNYSADGYASPSNLVLEFYGDYFHGNPRVYDRDEVNKTKKCTFGEIYDNTMARKETILALGFKYEDIWEYDWKRAVRAVVKLQRLWRVRQNYVIKYVLVFPPRNNP